MLSFASQVLLSPGASDPFRKRFPTVFLGLSWHFFFYAIESDASDPFNPTFRGRGVRRLSQRPAAFAVLCRCCPRMETEMPPHPRASMLQCSTLTCLNVQTLRAHLLIRTGGFFHLAILARRCLPDLPGEDP